MDKNSLTASARVIFVSNLKHCLDYLQFVRKRIVFPEIIILNHNIERTSILFFFFGTTLHKNVAPVFVKVMLNQEESNSAGFKPTNRNIRISVSRSFVRGGISLSTKKFSAMQFAGRQEESYFTASVTDTPRNMPSMAHF